MTTEEFYDGDVVLHLGDSLAVLPTLPSASFDAVVTDPPYGLEFMGKDWDRPWAVSAERPVGYEGRDGLSLPAHRDGRNANCRACGGRARGARRCACEEPDWDRSPREDMVAFQAWCERWARECLRVLKPGGYMLAFGGTRTSHRLACAIEDAGFEMRDAIAWLYGQGYPKNLNVSKALDRRAGERTEPTGTVRMADHRAGSYAGGPGRVRDVPVYDGEPVTDDAKQWQGWGTALKPSYEPIVVGRKPLAGTVLDNLLAHGTGALNIDVCRTSVSDSDYARNHSGDRGHAGTRAEEREGDTDLRPGGGSASDLGRWPANAVLDGAVADDLDRQAGVRVSGANPTRRGSDKFRDSYGEFKGQEECAPARGAEAGGASRFFPVFRYEAKAPADERPRDGEEAHPTVKPLELMRWLVRLVTPPGGLVLDPFAGSGTTGEAVLREGMRAVLVEREEKYARLIGIRLAKPQAATLL